MTPETSRDIAMFNAGIDAVLDALARAADGAAAGTAKEHRLSGFHRAELSSLVADMRSELAGLRIKREGERE